MANSYLPETRRRTAAIKKLQIATLIGDLSRKADILTADIEHEEARVGIRDMSDPAYSVLGAEPEGAKGEHRDYHRFSGGLSPRNAKGGLSRP